MKKFKLATAYSSIMKNECTYDKNYAAIKKHYIDLHSFTHYLHLLSLLVDFQDGILLLDSILKVPLFLPVRVMCLEFIDSQLKEDFEDFSSSL